VRATLEGTDVVVLSAASATLFCGPVGTAESEIYPTVGPLVADLAGADHGRRRRRINLSARAQANSRMLKTLKRLCV